MIARTTLVGLLFCLCAASTAEAQWGYSRSFQGPSNQTLGTRRGAVVGGVIGGVVGARNDRPVVGILAGSVVGGLVGREVGRQQDIRSFNQSQNFGSPVYGRPYYGPVYGQPQFASPYNYPRQYYRPPQQPQRIIRYGW